MQSLNPAHRQRFVTAIGTFALISGALVIPASAATTGTPPVIVGMGDSYTSGLGAPPYTDSSTCYRSTQAYPLLAAKTLGYTAKNIACAGTDTEDVQITFNNEPAQTESLGDPDWVVMTIGGNNANILGGVLQDETPIDTVISNLGSVSSAVESVLTHVQTNAPNADVILVGYPDVLPANATSLNSCLGNQAGDVDLAKEHEAFQKLNDAQKTAAQKANAIFVDTSQAFVGHDACATDAWITGVDDPDAPFHLNASGQIQIANMVVAAIEKVDGSGTSTTPTSTSTSTTSTSTPVRPTTSSTPTTAKAPSTPSTMKPPVDETTTERPTQTASTSDNERPSMRKHHRKHHCLGHKNHHQSFVQNGRSPN
jgi:lysophospholipase L1-like esterase